MPNNVSVSRIWFVYFIAIVFSFITFAYSCILALLITIFIPKHRPNINYYASKFYSRIMSRILGLNWNIINSELKDYHRPCIFVANHQSSLDLIVMAQVMPKRCVVLLKNSVRYLPFIGQYVTLASNLYIQGTKHPIKTILDTMEQQNLALWLYPEGVRSRSDKMLPFRQGPFRLAIERGIPIIPVVIGSFKPIFQRFKSFKGGTITVKFLNPIDTKGLNRNDVTELVEKVHAIMSREIELLNSDIKGE